jgi:hypothetical protein
MHLKMARIAQDVEKMALLLLSTKLLMKMDSVFLAIQDTIQLLFLKIAMRLLEKFASQPNAKEMFATQHCTKSLIPMDN